MRHQEKRLRRYDTTDRRWLGFKCYKHQSSPLKNVMDMVEAILPPM